MGDELFLHTVSAVRIVREAHAYLLQTADDKMSTQRDWFAAILDNGQLNEATFEEHGEDDLLPMINSGQDILTRAALLVFAIQQSIFDDQLILPPEVGTIIHVSRSGEDPWSKLLANIILAEHELLPVDPDFQIEVGQAFCRMVRNDGVFRL